MKKSFCDICGVELKNPVLAGAYCLTRIEKPIVVEISISASRPIPDNFTLSHPPLDICLHCVLDAIIAMDDRPKQGHV